MSPARSRRAPEALSEAELLHRRAVEVREFRRGRATRPEGVDAPESRVTGSGVSVTYPVAGMTCRSCEVRIQRLVSRIPGVEHVSASALRGQVTIESRVPISPVAVERAISKAGNEIGRTPWVGT